MYISKYVISIFQITDPLFWNEFVHDGASFAIHL